MPVVTTGDATTMPGGSASEKLICDSEAPAFGFVTTNDRVEVWPAPIVAGVNDLLSVGGLGGAAPGPQPVKMMLSR